MAWSCAYRIRPPTSDERRSTKSRSASDKIRLSGVQQVAEIPVVGTTKLRPSKPADHLFRRSALGGSSGRSQRGRDNEPATILHQCMSHETQFGFFALSLAIELGLQVRRRSMRRVGRLLAMEVALTLRPGPGGSPEPSFALKLFIEVQTAICVPSIEKCWPPFSDAVVGRVRLSSQAARMLGDPCQAREARRLIVTTRYLRSAVHRSATAYQGRSRPLAVDREVLRGEPSRRIRD